MTSRYRAWCFTVNNWTEDQVTKLQELPCNYMVIGKELGEQGTPHLQGYLELENAKTFRALKKLLFDEIHLENQKGTAQQASDYTKKGGDFWEIGAMSKPQGFRSDLNDAINTMMDSKSLKQVAKDHPQVYIKFSKGFTQLYIQTLPKRSEKPTCYWFYGKSGTGKTREVYTKYEEKDIYSKNPDNKWWDGYEQQKVVLIDDLRQDHFSLTTLCRWFDRYPCSIEIKGGTMELNSPIMIITSDEGPHHWFQGNNLAQIKRRFNTIKYFE